MRFDRPRLIIYNADDQAAVFFLDRTRFLRDLHRPLPYPRSSSPFARQSTLRRLTMNVFPE